MDATAILTVVGFAILWALFRIERAMSRGREIASAHGLLSGIQASLFGEDGWARTFFSNNWTEERAQQRADGTASLIRDKNFEAIFEVPAAPGVLESLVASPYVGDLISMETVEWAGISLFKINLFVQFTEQQSRLLERHLAELVDPSLDDARRDVLVNAFKRQSFMLHRHGLGEPNDPGGWYWELEKTIERDVCKLSCARRARLYPPGTNPLLGIGDAIAVAALLATLVAALVT